MVSKAILPHDTKTRRLCLCSVFQAASLIILIYWIVNAFIVPCYRQKVPEEKTTDAMNLGNIPVAVEKTRNTTPLENTSDTMNVQNTLVEKTNDPVSVKNTPIQNTTDTVDIQNTPVQWTADTVNVQNTPVEKTTDTMDVQNTPVQKTTDTTEVSDTPVEKTTDTTNVQNTPVVKTTDTMDVLNTPVQKTTDTTKVSNTPVEKTIDTMNVQNTPVVKTTDTMNLPNTPVEKTIDMNLSVDNRSKETRVEKPADMKPPRCKNRCIPHGSESLPQGIVVRHSSLQMRPLWGMPKKPSSTSLLALAVGIKQKQLVDAMVSKFLSGGFAVMLFHYDGVVDEWKDLGWMDQVIHISATNQTKWWFAKRFLHPDVVAAYEYVFLWDEDLGVDNFDPLRYLSIVKEEGLEISQPALGGNNSEVHHQITARNRKGNVHRKMYKPGECDDDSKSPPCTGWIEVMAPVFSRPAWRCVWYLIQNDLIHVWGLDEQLGYCAQGDRIQNIGVVDAEYVVHHGLPTLGEPSGKKPQLHVLDKRVEVRRQSYNEYKIFRKRWEKAAKSDKCWDNPYPDPLKPIP